MAKKTRSKYLGVYNNYDNDKRYRVAVKRYTNNKPVFVNVGYFNQEQTAAWVFNIHALCLFGKGAVINDVRGITDAAEREMEDYAIQRKGFKRMIEDSIEIMEKHQGEIKIHK